MSSMRSASSSTKISMWLRSSVRWPWWSSRRPGRGDEDVDAAAQLVDLRLHADAAEHHHAASACCTCRRRARFLPPARRVRVSGVRISARIGSLPLASRTAGVAISRCSIGSVKPAVLPVPVCAPPSRSAPDRMVGNGLRLDRRGRVVTVFMHGTHDGLDQAEVCEVHIGVRARRRAMFAACGDPLRVHQSAGARDMRASESTAPR